jgi:transcriptional regulator with XRE-family HTH domain
MTHRALGDVLGVGARRIRDYEKGTGRVSPARLDALSLILGMRVSDFFADYHPSHQEGRVEDSEPEREK